MSGKWFILLCVLIFSVSLKAQLWSPENPRGSVVIIGGQSTLEEHAGDTALRDKLLQMNFAVGYYRDGDMETGVVPRDSISKYDLLIASESASSSKLRQLVRWEYSIPTINMEAASVQNTHHKLELISTVVEGNGWLRPSDQNANEIKILNGDHPLAAGFETGQVLEVITDLEAFRIQYPFGEGIVGYMVDEIGVIPIASFNTAQGDTALVICGIEVGTANVNGASFNARYVQFNTYSTTMTRWTASTDSLLAAAIEWVLNGTTDVAEKAGGKMVSAYSLSQNFPNPFNPSTGISFSLPQAGKVRIDVYNTLGERVATIADRELAAGTHQVTFDASGLPSGVYIYRMQTAEYVSARKMALVR